MLDTRRLLVSLPVHKCTAWQQDIKRIIDHSSISHTNLKSLIGKLEHVIMIVHIMGHFMNNLCALEMQAASSKHNVKIANRAKEDAKLHLKFLQLAKSGVSVNLLAFRKPDHTIVGDACEHGLGAFHLESGRAFRFIIPDHLRGRAHINSLEFITQVVQIWTDVLEGRIQEGTCILAMGDSTAAMGWLRRSNFREHDETDREWHVKQQVARKLAWLLLDIKACLHSQWFAGN